MNIQVNTSTKSQNLTAVANGNRVKFEENVQNDESFNRTTIK